MNSQTDAVVQLRVALRELARDPRAVTFRVKRGIELLESAIEELAKRQADIAAAVLLLDGEAHHPLEIELRDRLERYVYGADVPRVNSDD